MSTIKKHSTDLRGRQCAVSKAVFLRFFLMAAVGDGGFFNGGASEKGCPVDILCIRHSNSLTLYILRIIRAEIQALQADCGVECGL